MQLEGVAEENTSVLTNFKFPSKIENYWHGTPYHWDTKQPGSFGYEPYVHLFLFFNYFSHVNDRDFQVIIEATHNFIIPYSSSSGTALGGIYHSSVPAWGVLGDTLIGVTLRNTPEVSCANKGAAGSDYGVHIIEYALRVPSGLSAPITGLTITLFHNNPN